MRKNTLFRGALCALVSLMTLSFAVSAQAAEMSSVIDYAASSSLHITNLIQNDGTSAAGDGTAGQTVSGTFVSGTVFSYLKLADISQKSFDGKESVYYTSLIPAYETLLEKERITLTADHTEKEISFYMPETLEQSLTALNEKNRQAVTDFVRNQGTAMDPTDENGSTGAEKLSPGLYLVAQTDTTHAVTENDQTLLADGAVPFLVSLPMTNQTVIDGHKPGTVWQYDVSVYPKNSSISLSKYLIDQKDELKSSDDYGIGDNISQVIIADVPVLQQGRSFEVFSVCDTMEEGLTFIPNSLKVCLGAAAWPDETADVLTKDTDYTVSQGSSDFTVSLTKTGLARLGRISEASKLNVVFSAYLNGKASIGIDTNDNTPVLSVKEKGSDNVEITGNTPHAVTYEMAITKKFSSLTAPDYNSVKFTLADAAGTELEWTREREGIYHLWDGKETVDKVREVSPSSEGLLRLKGLDEGSYILTETATVPGQNLLADPVKVTMTGAEPSDGSLSGASVQAGREGAVVLTDQSSLSVGTAAFSIVNNRAVSMLRTGGEGTFMLIILSLLFLLTGGALYFTGRFVRRVR